MRARLDAIASRITRSEIDPKCTAALRFYSFKWYLWNILRPVSVIRFIELNRASFVRAVTKIAITGKSRFHDNTRHFYSRLLTAKLQLTCHAQLKGQCSATFLIARDTVRCVIEQSVEDLKCSITVITVSAAWTKFRRQSSFSLIHIVRGEPFR